MRLTVLSVAYPLAPVSEDSVGGAEQVLHHLDAALVAEGHRSLVIACEGSRVAGELVPVPRATRNLEQAAGRWAWEAQRRAVERTVRRERPDLVHLHGIDFDAYLPPPGPPALVTLHAPREIYRDAALSPGRPDTWFVTVSRAQRATFPADARFLEPIENGVPVERLAGARHARRGFALVLARICPEKGVHCALQAAHAAGRALIVAGEVFPYTDHLAYFEQAVRPLLDRRRRFIGPLDFAAKRRFLSAARGLLVPSLIDETSSLVAREALACGTPVIAFRRGALPEAIDHGRTGWLVDDVAGMAAALDRLEGFDPALLRAEARARFSLEAMTARYLGLYAQLARGGQAHGAGRRA